VQPSAQEEIMAFETRKLVQSFDNPREGRSLVFGFAGLGANRGAYDLTGASGTPAVASVSASVPDGDTIGVRALGNLGVRLLGIDTPETKTRVPRPGGSQSPWLSTDNEEVKAFLDQAFDEDRFGPFRGEVSYSAGKSFLARLAERIRAAGGGAAAAVNHRVHAKAAEDALERMITADCAALYGGDLAAMQFHLAYGNDVFDRYGRLLAHVNVSAADRDRRPPDYNMRLAAEGWATPYFIWPNIQPFLGLPLLRAAMSPADFEAALGADDGHARRLRDARAAVAAARSAGQGIYAPGNRLVIEASELRMLTGRRLPSRRVIDLRDPAGVLLPPTAYLDIPNAEDRLFIPPEFDPLFAARGWRLG
jgi:endonuclease YncB( thermonuclease family)